MNHGLKLTPKMITDLAEGYQSGKTTSQLAEEFSISKATICRALRKMGIEPERKDNMFTVKELTQEEKASIILDFRAGLKISDLSRKYGYSYPVLTRMLTENDLWTKKIIDKSELKETKTIKVNENNIKRILGSKEQLELCEKFVDGPYTKAELATEYNIHVDTVSAILRRHDALIKRYIANEVIDMICDEYKAGVSIYKLSTAYNNSPETIKYWLTKRKVLATLGVEGDNPQLLATPKKKLTKAEFRELAQSDTLETYEILLDIARDPTAGTRNRITAIALIHERAHGKAREELEEDKDTKSAADKIMDRLPDSLKKLGN